MEQQLKSTYSASHYQSKILSIVIVLSLMFTLFTNELESFHRHSFLENHHGDSCSHGSSDSESESQSDDFCSYFAWHANSADSPAPLFVFTLVLPMFLVEQCSDYSSLATSSAESFNSRAPPISIS